MTTHLPKVAEASRLSSSQNQKQDASATLSSAPKGSSTAKASTAPKGRNIPAQGNALGSRHPMNPSPEGAAQGWRIVKLEEIADIRSGNGFPIKYQGRTEGEFPFFKVGDISRNWQKGMITLTNGEHCLSQAEVKAIRAKTLPEGSVVFAKIGAAVALNRRAILGVESLVDNNVMALIPSAKTTSRFLFYYMCQVDLGISTRGGAVPSLRRGDVADLEIPLAPLPEQRRIVARIEELFSRLDAGVAALRHAKAQLQRYRQSVLAAAVTGQLTQAWREQHPDTEPAEVLLERICNARALFFKSHSKNSEVKRHVAKHKLHKFKEPENWSTPTTWKFASLLTSCQFVVDCHNKTPPYEDSGVPLIRTTNVRCGKLAWPKMKFVNEKTAAHWSQRCTPEAGDILFTREAPSGEAAIIPENTRVCMGQRMMLFRTFHDLLLPSYLLMVIQYHNFQTQYGDKQVGVGVQHLRVGDVESLVLPIPPLAEQHRIVAEVEARTTAIDHLEAELDRQITRSNRLRQSVLAAAFRSS